jgi:hypothetical protein
MTGFADDLALAGLGEGSNLGDLPILTVLRKVVEVHEVDGKGLVTIRARVGFEGNDPGALVFAEAAFAGRLESGGVSVILEPESVHWKIALAAGAEHRERFAGIEGVPP